MKKYIALFYIAINQLVVFAQVPHDYPLHPRGNVESQLMALPFYNEACIHYKNGDRAKAKSALYKSINIDFALVESQLFLADLFYEEGLLDSAFFYYNSGIDFVIEQPPHYYFKHFELGMELGEYDWVKHTLKHFKKLYGKKDDNTPYEEGYPYCKTDFEYYDASLLFVYNYKSWIPRGQLLSTSKPVMLNSFCVAKTKRYVVSNEKLFYQKSKAKMKLIKNTSSLSQSTIFDNGSRIIYTKNESGKTQLYIAQLKGKKLINEMHLPDSINAGTWQGYPFMTEDGKTLYFSSNKNGTKDLFQVSLNLEFNTCGAVLPLSRINTVKDEIAPFLDEKTGVFYFSSNGHIGFGGFGGFDLYQTLEYEVINGSRFPINAINMKAPFNSNEDELMVQSLPNGNLLLMRKNYLSAGLLHEYLPLVVVERNLDLPYSTKSNE
ncbi:MAG: hypothetical protein QE487_15890 [Fluviicola sp.]|nr:hypothetical protein [Fluviicola sp.]